MLEEADVGICAHANGAPGFDGILRHRFSDFKVNEIATDMTVARLTCLKEPEALVKPAAKVPFTAEGITECVAAFRAVAEERHAAQLQTFLQTALDKKIAQAGAGKGAKGAPVEEPLSVALAGFLGEVKEVKEQRSKIHHFCKSAPGVPQLSTDTITIDGASAIRIMLFSEFKSSAKRGADAGGRGAVRGGRGGRDSGRGGRGGRDSGRGGRDSGRDGKRVRPEGAPADRRGLDTWPGGPKGRHVAFVLHKENKDTHACIAAVARHLGVRVSVLGFAGTKDKRGLTTQHVTAFRAPVPMLLSINRRVPGVMVGNFRYVESQMQLGQLAGNKFTLVLRGLGQADVAAAPAAATALAVSGFINYFGMQRFGTGIASTHRVGQALLKGEWKAALALLMSGSGDVYEREALADARAAVTERADYDTALNLLPYSCVAERAVVGGLKHHKGADKLVKALVDIPRHLRSMYLHAWQSYVWNRVASARVQRHGLCVIEGDLVLPGTAWDEGAGGGDGDDGAACAADDEDDSAAAREAAKAGAAASDKGGADGASGSAEGGAEDEPQQKKARKGGASTGNRLERVLRVTAADVAAQRYTMEQVVLPLPGRSVQYPGNALSALYDDIAREEGISLTGKQPHEVKELSLACLTGDYRRVIARATDFSWHFVRHAGMDNEIVVADTASLPLPGPPRPPRGRPPPAARAAPPAASAAVPAADAAPAAVPAAGEAAAAKAVPSDAVPAAAAAAVKTDAAPSDAAPAAVAQAEPAASDAVAAATVPAAAGTAAKVHDVPPSVAPCKGIEDASGHACGSTWVRDAGGEQVSLVMTFSLPSSTYATMLTRELLKRSTMVSGHKAASAVACMPVAAAPVAVLAPEESAAAMDSSVATGSEAVKVESKATESVPVTVSVQAASGAVPEAAPVPEETTAAMDTSSAPVVAAPAEGAAAME